MNEDGGKWVASYPKAQRDSFEEQWLWTMLAVIGGAWGGEGTPCTLLLWVCLSARRLLVVGGFSPFVAFVALTSWFNLIRALFCFVVNMNFAQSNEKTHVFHPPPPHTAACVTPAADVCGVVASVRRSQDRIAVWTKTATARDLQMSIGNEFRDTLQLSAREKLQYIAHKESTKKNRSYNNSSLYEA